MREQLLLFRVDGHHLALRAGVVREVLRAVTLSAPLDQADSLEGFLNLRGRTLPVINLRSALGLKDKPVAASDVLIVVDDQEATWVLRGDGGLTIHEAAAESIETSAPSPFASESVQIAEQVTFLLDPDALKRLIPGTGRTVSRAADVAE